MCVALKQSAGVTGIQGGVYALAIFGTLWLIAWTLDQPFDTAYQVMGLLMAGAGFVVLGKFDLMTPWMPGRTGSIGTRVCRAWVTLVGILLLLGYLSRYTDHFSRAVLVLWFVFTPLVLWLVHKLAMGLAQRFLPQPARRRTAVVVFVNDSARSLGRNLRSSRTFELVGFFEDRDMDRIGGPLEGVSYLGHTCNTGQYVRDHSIDVVFVVLPDDGARRALNLLDDLGDTAASIYYVPDFTVINLFQAQIREVEGVTVLEVAETPFYGADGTLKQWFDLGFAIVVLVLLSPLMLLIALLVKLSSRGPVISRQRCYGLNGERFHSYRFRSLRADGEANANANVDSPQSAPDDSRVTAVGRFIRRTAIDELPQLFNVLKGDMSVVGPRPHTVAHNEYYRLAVKRYMVRHKVKPGLTGWAQVHGLRGDTAQL